MKRLVAVIALCLLSVLQTHAQDCQNVIGRYTKRQLNAVVLYDSIANVRMKLGFEYREDEIGMYVVFINKENVAVSSGVMSPELVFCTDSMRSECFRLSGSGADIYHVDLGQFKVFRDLDKKYPNGERYYPEHYANRIRFSKDIVNKFQTVEKIEFVKNTLIDGARISVASFRLTETDRQKLLIALDCLMQMK